VHSSTCARKRQLRQGNILCRDKIVPAECPAGHGTGLNADSEVKRLGLVMESKIAATSRRSHRVFGPHGNDRYNLDPDMDQNHCKGSSIAATGPS
jgi:hypothetical protein